jgi:uncharacterized membrane protein YqgA involved in biofilm formation
MGEGQVIDPIQDATGQPNVLYLKAIMNGTLSIMMAGTLGLGV